MDFSLMKVATIASLSILTLQFWIFTYVNTEPSDIGDYNGGHSN